MIRRQRIVIGVATMAAGVSIAGLIASVFVMSPAQQSSARRAAPPTALTADVQEKVLRTTVAVRGQVVPGGVVPVRVRPGSSAAHGASLAVITALPLAVGARIENGSVVLEISGRPVIALIGELPAYRDLRPGDSGPDVAQLQRAMALRL